MPQFSIKDLAKIIERDSKDATYKYALLRGSIEIIQENDNYKRVTGDVVSFPLGLLVLKWIEYYYPILSSKVFIPQKHGDSQERTIAFRREFENVIELYPGAENSYPLFYDLKRGITKEHNIQCIMSLVRSLKNTIVKQPMHYIGSAIERGGEIFRYNKDGKRSGGTGRLSIETIIGQLGTFSIPIELYHVMQVVGSFVTGTHSLIFRWAEFTSNISEDPTITTSNIISLLKSDFNERDIVRARNYYTGILEKDSLPCVWSGKPVRKELHVDHMIPFVAIRNNDLWNLLPSRGDVNIRKSDRIPDRELLKRSSVKERILFYWGELIRAFPVQFQSEIQVALLGNTAFSPKGWQNDSYDQLIRISHHLIEDRGFSPWTLNE